MMVVNFVVVVQWLVVVVVLTMVGVLNILMVDLLQCFTTYSKALLRISRFPES